MGPHFMLLVPIYVLCSNVTYIYPVSCLAEIKLFHCLPCNSSHNVVNRAIGIMEAFSNVNIAAKLQEVESSCRCTYNGVGGVIM